MANAARGGKCWKPVAVTRNPKLETFNNEHCAYAALYTHTHTHTNPIKNSNQIAIKTFSLSTSDKGPRKVKPHRTGKSECGYFHTYIYK